MNQSYNVTMIPPPSGNKVSKVTIVAEGARPSSGSDSSHEVVAQDLEHFFNNLLIDLQVNAVPIHGGTIDYSEYKSENVHK